MKILRVAPAYYPATYWGGPTFCDYLLNNALAELPDVSLKVLTTDTAGPRLTDRLNLSCTAGLYPNQEVLITRRIVGADISVEFLRKLPALIRWADVVHLSAAYSFPTIPTLFFCRILRKPLAWSPHGAILDAHQWEGARRKGIKRTWEIFCNSLIRPDMAVVHANSEVERQVMQTRIPKAKAVMISHGVDIPDTLPEREWLPSGRLRLMYLGRLAPKKGIENLLQAVSQLNDSSITLAIYGSGDKEYTNSLQKSAAKLRLLGNSVFFEGHVEGEAKSAAFYKADVCVVPSHTESFCMVVAESLAHGVPVIASYGTPWGALDEQGAGLWVSNTPKELIRSINKIRTMSLESMGKRGYLWMKKEFGWNVIAQQMSKVYAEMIENNDSRI